MEKPLAVADAASGGGGGTQDEKTRFDLSEAHPPLPTSPRRYKRAAGHHTVLPPPPFQVRETPRRPRMDRQSGHRRRLLLLLHIFVPLVLLLGLLPVCSSAGRDADKAALLRFKGDVSSDPGGLLSRWLEEGDPCSWPGVSCDARSRVVAVEVSGSGGGDGFLCSSKAGPLRRACSDPASRLAGRLSPAIGLLTELRVLRLPFHEFAGEVPVEIWGLRRLEVVDLEGSSVSGLVPSRLPPRLRVLNLASNHFHGEIPSSLSSCLDLEVVDLSRNQMSGTISSVFGALPKLRELRLSFNRLRGPIPGEIGDGCWNLQHLDLSGNHLVRGIPGSLGNCRKLRSLLLYSNFLEGALPADIGRLANLQVLDVSRNRLRGSVPEGLGNCSELSALVLSNPFDPFPYGENIGERDGGDFNYFRDGMLESITSLPKLRVLWAPRSTSGGVIPSNWGACASLEVVNLGGNLLTGEIPAIFEQCKNLKHLNLSSNRLSGRLKEGLPVPCLGVFDVSGNLLSGSIPRFSSNTCRSPKLVPGDLSSAYSAFFTWRTLGESPLPPSTSSDFAVHSFRLNKFTSPLPPLPIPAGRLEKAKIYAFLADGNDITEPLSDIMLTLSRNCNDVNVLAIKISNNFIYGEIPRDIATLCRSLRFLDVAGNQITGNIPHDLGHLDSLVGLDFSRNMLQGQIPDSIGRLKKLEYLMLAANNLSGEVPVSIGRLHSLKLLDLSSNSLLGESPGDLANLRNLSVHLLNNNNLSRIISYEVMHLSLSVLGVSSNKLLGATPPAASRPPFYGIPKRPLLSIPILGSDTRGRSLASVPNNTSQEALNTSSKHGFSSLEIASITSAAAIVSVLLALIVLYVYSRKCARRNVVQSSERREVTVFVQIGVPLTYENVVRATGGFNGSNCIGSGGFGATYKAEIVPGVLVAIKRLAVGRFQGLQQFHAEIKTLGRWRHPNLVTLIGYHISEAETFLIYNYLPGGNLEKFIKERSKRALDWRMLHKIALDVSQALAYLHDHCQPRILHRDVKPSNILLDNEFNAYLSDFGLARLLGNSETHVTTGVAGTFGYVAPEYAMTCRVSDKADVYSYGVVLLELISDKKALDPSFSQYGNGFNIVAWAKMLLCQGQAREFFIEGLWDVAPHDDLVDTLHLAVKCTDDSLSVRPTMKQVVQRLKQHRPPSF